MKKLKDLTADEWPREKMFKVGLKALSDIELLQSLSVKGQKTTMCFPLPIKL
jgi:DNA repair protein RadC